jgi:hypothetical protein
LNVPASTSKNAQIDIAQIIHASTLAFIPAFYLKEAFEFLPVTG